MPIYQPRSLIRAGWNQSPKDEYTRQHKALPMVSYIYDMF